ncbi:hypothetical protein DERA104750_15585 [Deinococcus radiodurans]
MEGGRCSGARQKQVAFGTDGRWISGTSTDDTFECSVAEWGQDPYPGKTKGCFIKSGSTGGTPAPTPTPTPSQPVAPAGYTLCAVLGGTCKDATNREVAFGGAGRYLFGRSTDATFNCSVAEWGSDPAPGVQKGCFLKNR